MARRDWRQEDQVDSPAFNDLTDDSLAAYPDEAARTADWFRPVTDLRAPLEDLPPPTLGQGSVIAEGTEKFFGVWNGQAWVPWRRVTAAESGLIQMVVTDVGIEEGATSDRFARFQIYLVNAEATITNFTDPRFAIPPADLGSRVIRFDYLAREYDPLTAAQRVALGEEGRVNQFVEAVAGRDFQPVAGTLTFSAAHPRVQEVAVPILSNPEDELAERFQLFCTNFRNVKPLKPIGICVIADTILPLLRVEDVTVVTTRISDVNPNIAARTIPIPIAINQAGTADINFSFETFDITAVGRATGGDYEPITGAGVIKAGATTPETPLSVRIPTQLLEATESFGFRVRALDLDADGNTTRVTLAKPQATITLQGRALKPTYFGINEDYGPGFGGGQESTLYMTIRCVPPPASPAGRLWSTGRPTTQLALPAPPDRSPAPDIIMCPPAAN